MLEQAANEREGQVALAKVDTDANQRLAAAFGIQGIPAVKAFKDGRVVAEFTGAQPPAAVERFFDALLPSRGRRAGRRRRRGGPAPRAGARAGPRRRRRRARPHPARARRARGGAGGAEVPGCFPAQGLAARLRLEEDPELAAAFAALDDGDQERGLDALIAAIAAADDADRKEDLRRAVVGVLDGLGVEHPLARESRRKLASALY